MTIPIPTQTTDLMTLSAALDAASHEDRFNWMGGLSKKELRTLYTMAEGALPLSVSHFHGASDEVVIHHGQNSLAAFNSFQKRCLIQGDTVQGYNHQALAWLTGPGHFVLQDDGDEVLFDYTVMPADSHHEFPPLKSNTQGLSTLVYGHMVDRVRRVSKHCVIGTAFKKNKPAGAWFMLLREGDTAQVD
jgi:hypothetical protein